MLVVFAGLPGTGKTAVAQEVARQLGATYLRIDAIEQALRAALGLEDDVADLGYRVAYAIATDALRAGCTAVADCVNPLPATRAAWREVAACTASPIVEAEVICSDAVEHRRRVESRATDIAGLELPTWAAVMDRDYVPGQGPRIVVDTSRSNARESAEIVIEAVERRLAEPAAVPAGA